MKKKYIISAVVILFFVLLATKIYNDNKVWYKFQREIKGVCSQVKKIDACTIGPTTVIYVRLKNSKISFNECEKVFRYIVTQLKENKELYKYVPKQRNKEGIPEIVDGEINFIYNKDEKIKYCFRTISWYSLDEWMLEGDTNESVYKFTN